MLAEDLKSTECVGPNKEPLNGESVEKKVHKSSNRMSGCKRNEENLKDKSSDKQHNSSS